jgi:hypothetical protein
MNVWLAGCQNADVIELQLPVAGLVVVGGVRERERVGAVAVVVLVQLGLAADLA